MLVLAVTLGRSRPALADDDNDCRRRHCLDLGARTGIGVGFGSITEGESLSDRTGGLVAVGLDAGYRLGGLVTASVDASYARVSLKRSSLASTAVTGDGPCFQGTSCSASLVRVGVAVRLHLMPRSAFDPWVGIGAGYEVLTVSESGQTHAPQGPIRFDAVQVSLRGLEYGRLELGGEARLGASFSLGPFSSFSVARYDSSRSSGAISVGNDTVQLDSRSSRQIVTTSLHEWLVFGVRGSFELALGH
jgi:hypothetical protein